jgi:thymidylate synthase (FAD)
MDKFQVEIPVHQYGYVRLLDHMGSDEDIVDAARISYDRRGKTEDRNLIRYLLRHKHTSPFEMGVLKFELKMPIFVARQWVRHRTASMNEVSARYTQLPNEMFIPEVFSVQSTDNKQGRYENGAELDYAKEVNAIHEASYNLYEEMLDDGVAREIARGVLPFNIYTKFVWKMDLHNLMHFLSLRLDSHAQQEIQDFAYPIEGIVSNLFPLTHEAFVDYVRDAYTCSRMEINILQEIVWMYVDMHDGDLNALPMCKRFGMSDREAKDFIGRFLPNVQK